MPDKTHDCLVQGFKFILVTFSQFDGGFWIIYLYKSLRT